MYRLGVLNETLMKRFITQTIWKVVCEPGDDRHLTNLVLQQGFYGRQTSLAVASTEAPETLLRFLLQQLRWSRSFYREWKWQISALPKQSWYLGWYTVYETLFPWLVFFWTAVLFYFPHPWLVYVKAFVFSFTILLIRTLVMLLYFRNPGMLYNVLYYPLYFVFLLPTKIFAGLTCLNNTWVTQSRHTRGYTCSRDAVVYFLFLALWQGFLLFGMGLTGLRFFLQDPKVPIG